MLGDVRVILPAPLLLCIMTVLPAAASDYIHTCRSATGDYEMDDGTLYRSVSEGAADKSIPYKTIKETILSHEKGYCLNTSGQRFGYEHKSYTIRIEFTDGDSPAELDMVCELAADGLPAAENCDRRVVTSSTEGTGKGLSSTPDRDGAPGSTLWSHNGSRVGLIAEGPNRRFVYEWPRPGMQAEGAKPGSAVFVGTRNGTAYSGTAYTFKAGCNPQGYPVSGEVSDGERRVTLRGRKPKIGKTCHVEHYAVDTLIFNLVTD